MPVFIERVDVTPATADGSFQTIDVTAHVGADAGDIAGVLLRVGNESTTERTLALRKYGSSDNYAKVLEDKSWQQAAIGVDSSDRFEAAISNTAVKVYLEGYFTNDEAAFFTTAIDKTPATTGSYQIVDISSDTGGDTAKVAIFMVIDSSAGDPSLAALPYNWTDDVVGLMNLGDIRFIWTGLDGSERCNVYTSAATCKFYLVGYLKDNLTLLGSLTSYDVTSANYRAFYDLDLSGNVPDGANGVFFITGDLEGASAELIAGARKNGDTLLTTSDYWDASDGVYGLIEVDANRVIEFKSESSAVGFWIWGYSVPPSGIAPVQVDLNTASLTAGGQNTSLAPGAVSKSLDTALLSADGQGITLVPGAVGIDLTTALTSANGQSVTILPGSISIELATALAAITGQIISIDAEAGNLQIDLSTAALTVNGQSITILPGTAEIALSSAVLNALGQAITIVPGAAAVSLSTSGLTINGQQIGIVPGLVSIALQTAALTANDIPVIILPGGISVLLSNASLTAGGQSVQILPGVYIVQLDTAQVQVDGIAIGLSTETSILLNTATLLADAQSISILVTVIGIIDITLQERNIELDLSSRSIAKALLERSVDLDLENRSIANTLFERSIEWAVNDEDR